MPGRRLSRSWQSPGGKHSRLRALERELHPGLHRYQGGEGAPRAGGQISKPADARTEKGGHAAERIDLTLRSRAPWRPRGRASALRAGEAAGGHGDCGGKAWTSPRRARRPSGGAPPPPGSPPPRPEEAPAAAATPPPPHTRRPPLLRGWTDRTTHISPRQKHIPSLTSNGSPSPAPPPAPRAPRPGRTPPLSLPRPAAAARPSPPGPGLRRRLETKRRLRRHRGRQDRPLGDSSGPRLPPPRSARGSRRASPHRGSGDRGPAPAARRSCRRNNGRRRCPRPRLRPSAAPGLAGSRRTD